MPTDQFAQSTDQAHKAGDAVNDAAVHAQKALNEAVAAAVRTINTATKAAESLLKGGLDALHGQTKDYTEQAKHRLDEGQNFIAQRVKERPMTAAVAGLAVGFLLALLFSNRSK